MTQADLRRTLRAVPTLLRIGFAEAVAYRAEFLVWVLAYSMPLVMLALWTAVAREGPIAGFDETRFKAYFLTTLVVRLATGSWVVWEMNMEIRQGTLSQRLLRPVNPILAYACENVAAIPMRAVVTVPIALGALLALGPGVLSHDRVQLALLPLTVAGAWAMMFLVMAAIGTLGLFWESSLSLFDLWLGLYMVLSGYVMPLGVFPPWLRSAAAWTPFPYMLSLPVETALGLRDRAATVEGLFAQAAFILGLLAVLSVLWRAGVRRFAAYGG